MFINENLWSGYVSLLAAIRSIRLLIGFDFSHNKIDCCLITDLLHPLYQDVSQNSSLWSLTDNIYNSFHDQ